MLEAWDDKYEWCFSPLGTGDKVGVNNAGIGIFKKQPYIGLAKEILQNVIDAKDPEVSAPARASFEVVYMNRKCIPGADRLSDVIKRCYDYYHEGDDGEKMESLKNAAEELLDHDADIPVLKISDYHTIGLTGAHEEKGSNWTGLVREISATNKGNGLSGSFGVGKFAPYNFSRLRTIVYSTYNKDKETALQGKTILTTFKDKDGRLKQNVGLFGSNEDDDCKAIYDKESVPKIYERTEYGTDLYVLGFKEDEDWKEQIAVSVLEYFFYTIYFGNLEVGIIDGNTDIEINKSNLIDNINHYQEYCKKKDINFTAPELVKLLMDNTGNTKHFKENFRNKGEVELYLKLDPDFSERRVAEMRMAGMKIQEDTSFRLGAYFRGIFIATGTGSRSDNPSDNINSFLRKCENQAHDTWSKDEYEDNKDEADKIIRGIHKWIADKVKSEMPKVDGNETEAYGLSDLLPNQESEGTQEIEESAYSSFVPEPVDISSVVGKNTKKRANDVDIVSQHNANTPREITIPDDSNESSLSGGGLINISGESTHQNQGNEPASHMDSGKDDVENPMPNIDGKKDIDGKEQEEIKNAKSSIKLHGINISNVRTPYDNSKKSYKVIFMPEETADNVFVRIRVGADDDDRPNADIISASCGGLEVAIQKEFLVIDHIEKGSKVILSVQLKYDRRYPLEVTAYVK